MSRDIDRKVAEALGWTILHESSIGIIVKRVTSEGYRDDFSFSSTDIAAAIGALEEWCKVNRKGFEITQFRRPEDKPMCTILSFTEMDNGPITEGTYDLVTGRCFALGDTLPAAICAAILAAHNAGEGE